MAAVLAGRFDGSTEHFLIDFGIERTSLPVISFIDTMAAFAGLHNQVAHPSFGSTLDVGHVHCQGESIINEIRRWTDCLFNVHIEDMRRGVHDHLMFGEGEIDFGPVLQTLAEMGYAGGVHVELSRHSHDAVNSARQALAFLTERAGRRN